MSLSLKNKTVLITGASSGIGAACAKMFANAQANIILVARRADKLQTLAAELSALTSIYTLTLDVQNNTEVETAINDLPAKWQAIDILINNAGLARGLEKIQEANIKDWEEMIDTNVKGLLYMSRAVLPGMLERESGHIINIGSISGRGIYSGGVVYCATKHAVKAISEGLKIDCHGTPIRITEVAPGLVETDFSLVRYKGDSEKAQRVYSDTQPLSAEDVADSVLYAATRPLHVNIQEIVIMPVVQSSVNLLQRGNLVNK